MLNSFDFVVWFWMRLICENSILPLYYLNMQTQRQSEVKNLHQSLSGQLLPKSNELHRHVKDFLLAEVKDFEVIQGQNDKVLDQIKGEMDAFNKRINELKSKKSKDSKFIEGGAGYLTAKKDQISAKNKVLQSITTGLKQCVTKINPKKLAQLPYKKVNILKELFSNLYHILYHQPADKFDWLTFKKLGLEHENGEDFITRLANINYKELPQEYYDCLRKLKTDPEFINICQNSEFAFDLVDLADWIDYAVQGHKLYLEKRQCETEFEKIRKDIDRRKDLTMQLNEQFCIESVKDFDIYQGTLMDLQSEIRGLIAGMKNNLDGLQEIQRARLDKIILVNSLE